MRTGLIGLMFVVAFLPATLVAQTSAVPMGLRSGVNSIYADQVSPVLTPAFGTPITLHNYLHYKSLANDLAREQAMVRQQDGGALSPEHRALFLARYARLASDMNGWLAGK